jgi:hypothetical protein
MPTQEIEFNTKVQQFIKSEVSKKVKEEIANLKNFWQADFLLAQAKGVWEKEWDEEWQEIWL